MRNIATRLMFGASLGVLVAIPAQAEEDLEAKVQAVLDKHCARCHAAEKVKSENGPKKFGFILDLEKLAASTYVKPGNPHGSQLYTKVFDGSMPKDMVPGIGDPKEPPKEDLDTIAAWIESLGEGAEAEVAAADGAVQVAAATDAPKLAERPFIDDEAVLRAITDDLNTLSDIERPRTRYFTLSHLYNVGDSDEEMEVYRQAFAKFINHLSTKPGIVKPYPVDEAKTIFRINIVDLGWDEKTWALIEYANPYFIQYDTPVMDTLQQMTETKVPFVRADWFTFVASQPPLYYDILELPKTRDELEAKLGVDTQANRANLDVIRAGFQDSGVSQNNRMIERHTIASGGYWESFDFGGGKDRQSFFQFPLGPNDDFGEFSKKFGFEADGGEIIFSLPNGLQGYYLTDNAGNRLDTGPTNIVQDPERRDFAVTNGISCISCHSQGMQMKTDEVRDYVLATNAFPKEVVKIVEEIFPPKEEMTAVMEEDRDRFFTALRRAGVDPGLTLDGEEIVSALFKRFEREVNLKQAAAEFGMQPEEFEEALNRGNEADYALKQRLKLNYVPRDEFVELFAETVNRITRHHAFNLAELHEQAKGKVEQPVDYKLTTKTPQETKTFDLAFFPNEEVFKVGHPVTFTVQSELDCALTIINIDEKKKTTVLFPNKFNQNNAIKANVKYTFPSKEIGGFKFVFQDPGKETVIAKCNATSERERGIVHDYQSEAFTSFDSYDEYVSRSLSDRAIAVVADESGGAPAPKGKPKPKPVAFKPAENPYDPHVDIAAQAAIVLKVKK